MAEFEATQESSDHGSGQFAGDRESAETLAGGPPGPPGVARDETASGLAFTLDPTSDRVDPHAVTHEGAAPPRAPRALPTVPGYELEGELGRGGMGVVYLAREVRLNRPCALKMILAGAHASEVTIARFLTEARAVARLHHPSVVQIRHIGESGGLPYFELEYLPGGGLDKKLDGTPWPAVAAARFVEPLARAIAEAHAVRVEARAGGGPSSRGEAAARAGDWLTAEAKFAEALGESRCRDDVWLKLLISRLRLDDLAGYRRGCSTLLSGREPAHCPRCGNLAAWACVLGPGGGFDPSTPIRLAEAALARVPEAEKPPILNTLGAAFYRAGRLEEATRRLDEGIRLRGDAGLPQDWGFLAMAHHHLGHPGEGRRWLERLAAREPSGDPRRFWDEAEIGLLRREAEAVARTPAPELPMDVFARTGTAPRP